MNRGDRLTGILIALQAAPRTASALAARFEVSRRTIMRDIDALGEIGVPVIADIGRNGGYRIAEGFWLPPLHPTVDEATVLIFALQHIGVADQSPLGDAHRNVLEKLQSTFSLRVIADVERNLGDMQVLRDHDAPDARIIAALRRALGAAEWVEITHATTSAATVRTVFPLRIYTSRGRWYMDAADSLREEWRIFRISRIVDSRRTLAPKNATSTIQNAEASGKNYHHPDNPLVRVQLTERGRELAADHPDFRDHLAGNIIEFRCPPSEIPYYGRELVRFGIAAKVVGPPKLRDFMDALISMLADHYASDQM